MGSSSEYMAWLIARLRYLIELRGKSVARIEKELGRGRGYLGDALRGGKRLSVEMVLEVLENLGIEPAEFFAGRTREEERWGAPTRPTAARHEVAESPAAAEPSAAGEGAQDLEVVTELLHAVIRVLEKKGVVEPKELRDALGEERRSRTSGRDRPI